MQTTCPPGADYKTWAAATLSRMQIGIFRRVVNDLAPHFLPDPAQRDLAIGMAMHAIRCYMPENDADWFSAADIIAFSLTAHDLLKDAARPGLAPAMKLRYVGRAIQASRTARQAEAALCRRRQERQSMDPAHLQYILDNFARSAPPEPAPQPEPQPAATTPDWQAPDWQAPDWKAMEAGILRRLDETGGTITPSDAQRDDEWEEEWDDDWDEAPDDEPDDAPPPPGAPGPAEAAAPTAVPSPAHPDPQSEATQPDVPAIAPWLAERHPDSGPPAPGTSLSAEFTRRLSQLDRKLARGTTSARGKRRKR